MAINIYILSENLKKIRFVNVKQFLLPRINFYTYDGTTNVALFVYLFFIEIKHEAILA
jgi:hypothetical protein